jgi:hypothetical protein
MKAVKMMFKPDDGFQMVDELVRMDEFGPILVTRKKGETVREILTRRILMAPCDCILRIDFSDVTVLDYSFSDEAVGKLISRLVSGELGEKYVVLCGLKDDLRENIDVALKQRNLAVISIFNDEWECIGIVKPHLFEVLKLINTDGYMTARELSEHLRIALNTSSNRLGDLFKLKLISRKETVIVNGGRQFVYKSLLG